MYIKLPSTYPYSAAQLRADNPQTSFPSEIPDERLADWDVLPVVSSAKPEDSTTIDVIEALPVLVDGAWTQSWEIVNLTDEQITQKAIDKKAVLNAMRLSAYREESDPIFFKVQRGEATNEEWLSKISEIKSRYI